MLSVLVITKNAQSKIEQCLDSVKKLADEIVILDTGSMDDTIKIAKTYGAKIVNSKGNNFAVWRGEAAKHAQGDWLFYIDYDEEVTQELAKEIQYIVGSVKPPASGPVGSSSHPTSSVAGSLRSLGGTPSAPATRALDSSLYAYKIPRKNHVFGRWLKHGGFWPDYVLRLMKKEALVCWEGELHEQPVINGEVGTLTNALIHHKEDSLSDMIEKTNRYSVFEAKLLFKANHPPMAWWRFARIMSQELWYRLVVMGGILDGTEGILYGVYQMWSRFVTYAKLYELQRNSNIKN